MGCARNDQITLNLVSCGPVIPSTPTECDSICDSIHHIKLISNNVNLLLLAEHFIAFHELNKFNNSRAQMLDSIYHMTLRLL